MRTTAPDNTTRHMDNNTTGVKNNIKWNLMDGLERDKTEDPQQRTDWGDYKVPGVAAYPPTPARTLQQINRPIESEQGPPIQH